MNYLLHLNGESHGPFPLEELHRRREAGELTGEEYVWCEGMANWLSLDLVLQQNGLSVSRASPVQPPPLPRRKTNPWLVCLVSGAVLFIVVCAIFVGVQIFKNAKTIFTTRQSLPITSPIIQNAGPQAPSDGWIAATKPVTWTTNTLTARDVRKRGFEFRKRQWLDAYDKHGKHNPSWDGEARQFLTVWLNREYGTDDMTNLPSTADLSDRLVFTGCNDPLVLTIAGVMSVEMNESEKRLQNAINNFSDSGYKAYPKFYASVSLSRQLGFNSQDIQSLSLDSSSLAFLRETFSDGSLLPEDQQQLAETLLHGWARNFFSRNGEAVNKIVEDAGPSFHWLSLVLEGENNITEAWKARGGGYADSVSKEGWKGFSDHLATARNCLSNAWQMRPDVPIAADRMIYVSLGDSGIEEMRTWFDRAVAAQIDYPTAWSNLRWGLRPRWYGDVDSMLAFGVTALNTKRFDTDVPLEFFKAVSDVEAESSLSGGGHLYGRANIWPNLRKMYEGYTGEPSQLPRQDGWRSAYAIVSYLAGEYSVARKQLEMLDWKLTPSSLTGWNIDLSLMPLEVAARTGSGKIQVRKAESARKRNDVDQALALYENILTTNDLDGRTKEFINIRVASLNTEQQLQSGQWVNFLPATPDDPAWCFLRDEKHRIVDGALEVDSGHEGHFIFSRARVGANFRVKGEFDVVRSSTGDFQGGLILGAPDVESWTWYGFRLKRNATENDAVSFATGWSKQQISQPIPLNADHNTFELSFHNGLVNAFVNGQKVISNAKPAYSIPLNANDYVVGVGAFNDMNETTLRYRNLQVKKILDGKNSTSE